MIECIGEREVKKARKDHECACGCWIYVGSPYVRRVFKDAYDVIVAVALCPSCAADVWSFGWRIDHDSIEEYIDLYRKQKDRWNAEDAAEQWADAENDERKINRHYGEC